MDPLIVWISIIALTVTALIVVAGVSYFSLTALREREQRLHDRELRVASREEELMREHGKNIRETVLPIMKHLVPNANAPAPIDIYRERASQSAGASYEVGAEVSYGQVD